MAELLWILVILAVIAMVAGTISGAAKGGVTLVNDANKKKELKGCKAVCLYGDYKGQEGTIVEVYRPKTFTDHGLQVRLRVPLRVTNSGSGKEKNRDVVIELPLKDVQVED